MKEQESKLRFPRLGRLLEGRRPTVAIIVDSVLAVGSYWLAFLVGLAGEGQAFARVFVTTVPLVLFCRIFFFLVFSVHRGSWRYASTVDLLNILKAVASSQAAIIVLLVFISRLYGYPRRVFVIDALILVMFMGGVRTAYRLLTERGPVKHTKIGRRRTLIVGAGDAGEAVARDILFRRDLVRRPVGFVDDDPRKHGTRIHGVPVLGTIDQMADIAKHCKADEIVLAVPFATEAQRGRIYERCQKTRLPIKAVPSPRELITGAARVTELREVHLKGLLKRDLIRTDVAEVGSFTKGKTVLVTGAGGSIGSEICRQTLQWEPASLVLMEMGENSLHDIRTELRSVSRATNIYAVLGSVCDKGKLSSVFRRFRPQVVFHAAAYKHVDIVEENTEEGIVNNILGTRNVIEACKEFGAERLVVISTDKAADPTSVMGCTKRVCEMLTSCQQNCATVMVSVRFCNVLDSQGSVIPTFRRQIKMGGPITITDERMSRYFMTIPEAVELVIQAGAIGNHGDVLILKTGEPIRIVELAKEMLRLHGLVPGKDIEMKFIGRRPGEKLVEKLVGNRERLSETVHPDIRKIEFPEDNYDPETLNREIDRLIEMARTSNVEAVREKLRQMIPEHAAMLEELKDQ